MMKKRACLLFLFAVFLELSFVVGTLGYNNPNLPRIEAPAKAVATASGGNVSSVNSANGFITISPTIGDVILSLQSSLFCLANGTNCQPSSGGDGKSGAAPYLFNDTDNIYFNDTFANNTYDSRYLSINTILGDFFGRNFSSAFDTNLSSKTTDDLTEGVTNKYDNQSWNESKADTRYLPIETAVGDFFGRNFSSAFDSNISAYQFDNITSQDAVIALGDRWCNATNDCYALEDFLIDNTGGGGGNPFDQDLNTTSEVTFDNATISQNLQVGAFKDIGGDDDGMFILHNGGEFIEEGSRYVNITPSDYQTEDYLLYTPKDVGGKGSIFYVNGTGYLKWGDAPVHNQSLMQWNGTDWKEVLNSCNLVTPGSTCKLVKNETEVYFTTDISTSGLSDILTNGDTANAGQKIAFTQADVNLTSLTAGQLDIGAKNIEFHSNFSFASILFNYLVCDDCFAFVAEADRDAGLKFESAGTLSRFINTDLSGNEAVNITVFGANSGTVSIKDSAIIGDKLVVGTIPPTPNASFAQGDIWAAGGVFAAFFATHSPKLDCLEKETGQSGFYCIVTYLKTSRGNEFTEARVRVTANENFSILWSNETLNQEVLSHFAFIEENQKGAKEFENARRACEAQPFHQFTTQGEYRQGSRECTFMQSIADSSCLEQFGRENGRFYSYNQNTGQCERNEQRFCEQFPWQRWNTRLQECQTNDISECLINGQSRNQTWDFNEEMCVFSAEIECSNRGMGWEWTGRQCEFSERLAAYECIQENPQCNEWRQRACVDRCER
jgi:hypothetical protein